MTTPTPEEIEALARELREDGAFSTPATEAAWILTRFVRREEAEGRKHLDLLLEDNARLRAELRQQRCDGSSWFHDTGMGYGVRCTGCPACKPDATPQGDGGRKGATIGYGWNMNDGGRTPESVSEAVESAVSGAPSQAPDVPAAPVPQVLTIELGPETLRTVVALAFAISGEELTPVYSIPCADALLTHLREKETK